MDGPVMAENNRWWHRVAALPCDLNRSMQHLNSNYRERGVANEAETEKIYH